MRQGDMAGRRRWLRIVLLALALTAGFIQLGIRLAHYVHFRAYLGDFWIFWMAGQVPPGDLYGNLVALPFAYPPTALFLVTPFGLLPFWPAFAAWVLAGAGLTALALRRVVPPAAILVGFLTLAGFGVLLEGQISLFVSALAFGGIAARDPRLAALFYGAACAVKPQSMLALPFALAGDRRWRLILLTGTAGLLLVALSLLLYGPGLWMRWFASLDDFRALLDARNLSQRDVGLFGLFTSNGLPGWLYALGWPLGLATPFLVWRRRRDPAERYAALACGSVFLSPYTLGYDLAALTIVCVAILLDDRRRPVEWLAAALIVGQVLPAIGLVLLAGSLLTRPGALTPPPDLGK